MSKTSLSLICVSVLCQAATAAVPTHNVRPDFQDPAGPSEKGGFVMFHTHVEPTSNAPVAGSGATRIFLTESRYGHPFAVTQTLALGSSFVQNTLRNTGGTGVYDELYPAGYRSPTGVTASRSEITDPATGGAFRYRWLMYGEGGADESGNPVILNLFAQTFQNTSDDNNPWYGDDERAEAQTQIETLRSALASAPLNQELQLSLLDIYYDLAVAEMQFVNKRLAKLATIRLGLDSSANEFVIDKEIAIYRELVQVTGQAVAWYSELLCFEMAGIEPGDFSPRFNGAPFGHFLFVSRVPSRSQAGTELGYASATPRVFTATSGVATISLPGSNNDFTITSATFPQNFRVVMSEGGTPPTLGTDTLSIPITTDFTTITEIKTKVEEIGDFTVAFLPGNDGTGTASTASGTVDQILTPGSNSPVFAGYKDYRTFLTILGQLIQYKADLAKLLAMRTSAGDVTEARQILADVQGPDSDTYIQLKGLFPDTDFDSVNLDSSGVRAALELVKSAIEQAVGVRSFVNGSSNPVGLDPNFLLIVEKQPLETAFDSYDLLKERINARSGNTATGALEVALDALGDPTNPLTGGGAIQAYSTFLGGVSQTAGELLDLEIELGNRFAEITGYSWNDGVNGWDGRNPAAGIIGSDLATVNRTLTNLAGQQAVLKQVLEKARADVKKANAAVGIAEGIKDSITGAEETYLSNSEKAYEDLAISNARAAVAQNTFEGAVAGASLEPSLGSIAGGIAITFATVANGIVQKQEAKNAGRYQQDIDRVAIQHQTKLALADQALTVQQSLLAIGELERAVLSVELQIKSNLSAYAQALADRAALIREINRIEGNFRAKRKDLASAYFADPIHYQRAEASLLSADAAFARAQRWLFITARALEYKWQERFLYTNAQVGLTDDIGSIFKARNALELKRIYQGMEFFNADRLASPGTLRDDTAAFSLLNHVLTPNPADIDLEFGAFPVDDGLRYDPSLGTVTKLQHFQKILDDLKTGPSPGGGFNPPLKIVIDTTQIEKGQLFAGPTYTYDLADPTKLTDIKSGLYRDKIVWLAVHFVFKSGAMVKSKVVPILPGTDGIDGSMIYAGNTFFRKRIPPYPDRSPVQLKNASDATIPNHLDPSKLISRTDAPGEFDINPFRYFQNTDPKTRIFETFDTKDATSLEFIFSSQSSDIPDVKTAITGASGYQINDFKELSVATTRLTLIIDANQFRIEDLLDIEIIVQHRAYTRPQLKLP